jgi:hypothetical protein
MWIQNFITMFVVPVVVAVLTPVTRLWIVPLETITQPQTFWRDFIFQPGSLTPKVLDAAPHLPAACVNVCIQSLAGCKGGDLSCAFDAQLNFATVLSDILDEQLVRIY